jgi:hypothetical protein
MEIRRLTTIDLQKEAVANGKSRQIRTSLAARSLISTRDARAHDQLADLKRGDSVHIASMGKLSLHDVAAAAALVTHYGPFECLTLSTWAASPEAIHRLIGLRTAGHVSRLEALVDARAPLDCPDAHALLKLSFDRYGIGQNHSKVMAFTGGPGIAVVSTANLTRNPRCEVLVVSMDTALAEFHRDWIREVLNA